MRRVHALDESWSEGWVLEAENASSFDIILVLTVVDDHCRICEAICAGTQGYLLKSTPAERLEEGIGELLGGGAPMSPGIARRVIERPVR